MKQNQLNKPAHSHILRNEQITNILISDIKGGEGMRLPYGFYLTDNGAVAIDKRKADTVRLIYRQYLSGMSLGGIADLLYEKNIPSPKGKER